MRQVMPHRNNIVSGNGSCKTFLRPEPCQSRDSFNCGKKATTDGLAKWLFISIITMA
jgi:hypothetical protein